MNDCTEEVVSEQPFTVRRRVRWSDCDPAAVVYTGRFTAYLLDAVMLFYRQIDWAPAPKGAPQKVGLMCKHMELTFHRSLVPDDVIDIQIQVKAVRWRSFDLMARAYLPDGTLAFEGVFSPICAEPGSGVSSPIPDALLEALTPHWRDTSGNSV